ncbi:hypothetical protein [Sporohalobacter salinus]|uniref:hypothetical protein n=1 Tax=Sporohalobacter salinus TaxID=1494606 RepID=UPI00196201C6|nr:hypothetical protein [Sporohalobacter salinus]MBM7623621.1 threonine/homoserine/homoserine lactone efflux protein [Sporohalobacter salinus]
MKKDWFSQWLRNFFVLHFIVDIIFALPLFLIPRTFLKWFGWQTVDPIATRLVAAALFGIGIESLLGRNADKNSFKAMLNLKIIWSLAAIVGMIISLVQKDQGNPLLLWAILVVFIAFNFLWIYWRLRLKNN